jgi:hypothetical protein
MKRASEFFQNRYFGGVNAFTKDQFTLINGFSNVTNCIFTNRSFIQNFLNTDVLKQDLMFQILFNLILFLFRH